MKVILSDHNILIIVSETLTPNGKDRPAHLNASSPNLHLPSPSQVTEKLSQLANQVGSGY